MSLLITLACTIAILGGTLIAFHQKPSFVSMVIGGGVVFLLSEIAHSQQCHLTPFAFVGLQMVVLIGMGFVGGQVVKKALS